MTLVDQYTAQILFGSSVAVGLLIGSLVAIFNSWRV